MTAVSAYTVASLQQGLDSLAERVAQPREGFGPEAVPILEAFLSATEILIESAEEVAASHGHPTIRNGIVNYARELRQNADVLQSIMENLEQGQGFDAQTKDTAVAALRKIGELTSELVEIEEDHDQKSMNDATTECATAAKELVTKAIHSPNDLGESTRLFAVKSVNLVRVLSNMATKFDASDPETASQLRLVSNAIAGIAPSLIHAVTTSDRVSESLLKHVQSLTTHIQQALALSRECNSVKRGTKLEIPKELLIQRQSVPTAGRRKKTIENASQGMEVLKRARGLTRSMDVSKAITDEVAKPSTASAVEKSKPQPHNMQPVDPEKERLRSAVLLLKAENERLRAKLAQIAQLAQP